jgi:uncharacterized protein (DUF885 family)
MQLLIIQATLTEEEKMKFRYLLLFIIIISMFTACPDNKISLSSKDILIQLKNLPFTGFLEESYKSLLKTYPELVTEYGMDELLNMSGTELNSYDEDFLLERAKLEEGILSILQQYDKSTLKPKERISSSIYEEYLKDLVNGHKYRHHEYLLSYMITSVNIVTEQFFTEIIPINNVTDIKNYIKRLQAVYRKMEEVDRQLQIQEEMGIILSASLIPPTLNSIRSITVNNAVTTPFYTTLKDKIQKLDIDKENRDLLLKKAELACKERVLPGYQLLEQRLLKQQKIAGYKTGVNKLPDGYNYYNYLIRHHTNSDMNIDEIHNKGLEELNRIHDDMRFYFAKLGYDTDKDIDDLYKLLEKNDRTVSGNQIVETHKQLMKGAQDWMKILFNDFPNSEAIVKADKTGGYYIPPSFDGSRKGAFYASTGSVSYFTLPTLTFHETYPGHHYQIALTAEMDLPLFQKQAMFNGYLEGWALYSEYLMSESGFYLDNPFGELGHLQAEAFRAARLVVDTGIHIYDWSINKAAVFFAENTGFGSRFSRGQIYRYMVLPGQAASYYTGYIEFKNILVFEKNRLKESFNYGDFHQKVLENGPMPLTILNKEIFGVQ